MDIVQVVQDAFGTAVWASLVIFLTGAMLSIVTGMFALAAGLLAQVLDKWSERRLRVRGEDDGEGF